MDRQMNLRHLKMAFGLLGLAVMGFAAGWLPASGWAAAETKSLIKDFNFASLTIEAGTTVTWVNADDEPHTVASDAGLFRSGGLDTNESFSYKFDKPGTYRIYCTIHPRMVATIVVK
jgi:plastocyanin